mgnify:CR=1 FL=1
MIPGDIFDSWKAHRSPPELVNKVIEWLGYFQGNVYAVPGNHDLPYHAYENKDKSPYYTLVRAGVVKDLRPGAPALVGDNLFLEGFPYGYPVKGPDPSARTYKDRTKVAVVHDYCFTSGCGYYPGVDESKHANVHMEKLEGFDLALFGDQHKSFTSNNGQRPNPITLINVGGFARFTQGERHYHPSMYAVYDNLSSEDMSLATEKDMWAEKQQVEAAKDGKADFTRLFAELAKNPEKVLDFADAVQRVLRDNGEVRDLTRHILLKVLAEAQK